MGTSGSYGGPKGRTPLIPTWLDTNDNQEQLPGTPTPPSDSAQPTPQNPPQLPNIPALENPRRFTAVRNNFSRYVSSGGSDTRSRGRAIAGYIGSSSGGAKQAARKLGTSRRVAGRLVSFLSSAIRSGAAAALHALNLDKLTGHSIEEVFTELAGSIVPAEGTVDAGIARDAIIETAGELADSGITDLNQITFDQLLTILEIYTSRTIFDKLCNEIGSNSITLPKDTQQVEKIQVQLLDFIRRAVSDAIARETPVSKTLSQQQINGFVNTVYEQAHEILRQISAEEGNRK